MATLIDECLPRADISMRHTRFVPAPPERVYAALQTAQFDRSLLIRLLFVIRSVPAFLIHPRRTGERFRRGAPEILGSLQRITERGFGLVGERPGEEIVLGVVGRFWKALGELRPANRAQFRAGVPAGEVLAAWNFTVAPAAGGCHLSTETRIIADPAVLPTFRRYWFVVRPGSGLIRRSMLRAVARVALSAGP